MLIDVGGGAACLASRNLVAQGLDNVAEACLDVEFPERYVRWQLPGEVGASTLDHLEGLISYAGEALTHIDYPEGLLGDDFVSTTRSLLAKIRYPSLLRGMLAQQQGYQVAAEALQGNAACFDASQRTALLNDLRALGQELRRVEADLRTLYAQGVQQAQRDQRELESQGRLRPALPQPALSDHERELLAFYLGGIYWRMRGAGLTAYPPDPGQGTLRRVLYVKYPYQVLSELGGADDAEATANRILFDENWGYADWMDMGRNPGSADKYSDLVDMSARGKKAIQNAGPLLERQGFDVVDLTAGALQMGPCYFYAWDALRSFQLGQDLQDPYMWFLEGPTAIGEFCTGATLGLGLMRTLLWGKINPSCVASCDGRQCGYDGCGGPCGECATGVACVDGQCGCVPSCGARVCGGDGCGDVCGVCSAPQVCQQGQCVTPSLDDAGSGADAAAQPRDAGATPGDAVVDAAAAGDDHAAIDRGGSLVPEDAAAVGAPSTDASAAAADGASCACHSRSGREPAFALVALLLWLGRRRR